MLYCPNFFWNVLQVWMTGKDVYLQMTWSWPDKTWNILCSYYLQWNTSQSKFRNHYFLFLFAFSILSQLFLIWGCILEHPSNYSTLKTTYLANVCEWTHLNRNPCDRELHVRAKDFPMQILHQANSFYWPTESCLVWKWLIHLHKSLHYWL